MAYTLKGGNFSTLGESCASNLEQAQLDGVDGVRLQPSLRLVQRLVGRDRRTRHSKMANSWM